ncbi:MAG: SdrD B-like domain-containing protein, partial [Planctomycetota bacterium]
MSGRVDIGVLGQSRITGSVIINDDTEDRVFDGYAYNNTIRLTGTDVLGNVVDREIQTDFFGNFVFEGVIAGDYQLTQIQPEFVYDAFAKTKMGIVKSSNEISDIRIEGQPMSFGGFEFYEDAPGSISGFVYVDENGSGEADSLEHGIANVEIQLEGVNNLGEIVVLETETNSYGFYEFDGLRPGNYTVTQIQPGDYINAVENPGLNGGDASKNQIDDVDIFAGQVLQRYNFGEFERGSLDGYVFVDFDEDNTFDGGDAAIEGVTVVLSGTDFRGQTVSETTTTDSNGFYQFDNLISGSYELRQIQPEGFKTTYTHVGTFDEDDGVGLTNGFKGADEVTDIQLDHGRYGHGYNFSERFASLGSLGFEEVLEINGTTGNDLIEFAPGIEFHTVTINGKEIKIDARQVVDIRIDALEGKDRFIINGTEGLEQAWVREGEAVMRSGLFKVSALNGEDVFLHSGGGNDRAFMYDTAGDDRAKFTQDYTRLWNDELYHETRGYHRTYAYSREGGNDRAYFYDSKYDDTFKATANNARMIGRKFYSFGGGFERVYAYSQNGGNDTAYFWDSELDNDVFQVNVDRARLFNESDTFYNAAHGFSEIVGRATKGGENDRAYFVGTSGDEVLVSSPRKTNLVGDAFEFEAKSFERVYANSNGGNDSALLFDSILNDRFVSTADNARLFNDDYFVRANGFDDVDAFSSKGGRDRAYFFDSEGDDKLIALETEMRMLGSDFDNAAHGFARNYAYATNGGFDFAYLFDTDGADTFVSEGEVAKMYGYGYYNFASGFETAESRFTSANQHDRAIVFGAIDEYTMERLGDLSLIVNQHAAH